MPNSKRKYFPPIKMPELPEVQTVADHVKPELVGEHILSVEPV